MLPRPGPQPARDASDGRVRFNSLEFAVFLPIVVVLWAVLRGRGRHVLLLGASYTFYASWNAPFVLLLWFSTVLDFVCGGR